MRVISERATEPGHGLTKAQVRALVRALAPDYEFPGLVVYLKSQMPQRSVFERPVIYSGVSNRLNVCSRGLGLERVVREVLRELVLVGSKQSTRIGHRLSHSELADLDRVVDSLYDRVLAAVERAA